MFAFAFLIEPVNRQAAFLFLTVDEVTYWLYKETRILLLKEFLPLLGDCRA